jgi:hypothetical protein
LNAGFLVWLGAALLLAVPVLLTLEWFDEGHLLYAMGRVAQGAVPYVDFEHIYGPSTFFLNAAALRLFDDLLATRALLVLTKATIVAGVYVTTRWLAPPAAALAAAVIALGVYGAPIWMFNAPYASHYALALTFIAWLVFMRLRAQPIAAAASAGLLIGIAATFKQTNGLFAFLALALVILQTEGAAPRAAARLAWLLRVAVPLVAAAIAGVYLLTGNTPFNALVVGGPLMALCAWTAWGELRRPPATASWVQPLAAIAASAAFAVPLFAYAGWYASIGHLGELVYNTLNGLPQVMVWWVPFPLDRGLLVVAAPLGLVGAARLADARLPAAGQRGLRWGAVGLLLAALALWLWRDPADAQVRANAVAFVALPAAVLLTVWGAVLCRIAGWLPAGAEQRLAFGVLTAFAAVGALLLHPSADIWHVLAVAPAVLPIGAALATRVTGGSASAALVLLLAAGALGAVLLEKPLALVPQWRAEAGRFARATGVLDTGPEAAAAAATVAHLAERGGAAPIVVLSGEQMFYFLTDRPSLFEHEEYLIYLVRFGVIEPADARRLLDDGDLAARLAATRPLLVVRRDDPYTARLRAILPQTMAVADDQYKVAFKADPYLVLESRR